MSGSRLLITLAIFCVLSFQIHGFRMNLHNPLSDADKLKGEVPELSKLVDNEGPSRREIAVSDLPKLVDNEEGIQQLHEEYASIEGGHRRPWTVAQLPENRKKNRYYEDDLLPFDHSRVVLDKLPGDDHSDFINANYITGQSSNKEYVATQGPLPNTLNDFWRMVWQLNATKIIMLANLMEHGKPKVDQYWPEPEGSEVYGDILVTTLFEYPIPDLQQVVRTICMVKGGVKRIVRHFHFTGWPDLGVPEDRLPIVSILHQARLFDADNKAPIIVHCSAGIGRTGTVILLDSMIQRGKKEGVVDFPKRLDSMRTQRPDVVEKKEQYVFAHKAVSEVFNDPKMAKKLEAVEETYKLMELILDASQQGPPKNLRHALQRIKYHQNFINLLLDDIVTLDSENKAVPAAGA